jgi:hypothetical protein
MDLYEAEEAHPNNAGSDTKIYPDHNGRIGEARGLRVSGTSSKKFPRFATNMQADRPEKR